MSVEQDTPADAPAPVPAPPELLAWAKQTLDAQEFAEGVREIETTGGRTFEALLAEVEAVVQPK